MSEARVWPDVTIKRRAEPAADEATVLIHDDELTPEHYVIIVLQTIFELSDELAEHITWVAQTVGIARVVTRPLNEATGLVNKAHLAARLHGFPLTFSLEKEACLSRKPLRRTVIPFAVRGLFLLTALLLAVILAVADGAGGFP